MLWETTFSLLQSSNLSSSFVARSECTCTSIALQEQLFSVYTQACAQLRASTLLYVFSFLAVTSFWVFVCSLGPVRSVIVMQRDRSNIPDASFTAVLGAEKISQGEVGTVHIKRLRHSAKCFCFSVFGSVVLLSCQSSPFCHFISVFHVTKNFK